MHILFIKMEKKLKDIITNRYITRKKRGQKKEKQEKGSVATLNSFNNDTNSNLF